MVENPGVFFRRVDVCAQKVVYCVVSFIQRLFLFKFELVFSSSVKENDLCIRLRIFMKSDV
jgi:hypothetical protein